MSNIVEAIEINLISIMTTVLVGVITFIGLRLKINYIRHMRDGMKRRTVRTVVSAVESLYGDLSSEEKFIKASENVIEILKEHEITISEVELKMMIEEHCHRLNG